MIIGGALRGLSRAAGHSRLFALAYSVAGWPIVLLIGSIWGDTEYGNFTGFMLIAHFLSVIVILPAAVFANFAVLRLFRPRSWRHESWRGWVAGILGVPFVWGGLALWPHRTPPEVLRDIPGGDFFYFVGTLILFSNLAVLIGWLLPPWKRAARGGAP